jgi:DNA-binding beta-propeller fold protein YncE
MSLTRSSLVRRAVRGTVLTLACVAGASAGLAADHPARWEQRLEEGGVAARISIESLDGKPLQAGAGARLRVALSSATDGSAMARLLPGVWIDSHDGGEAPTPADCQRRVARYARGTGVNPQALVDLNGYDVLALNADASVSVLDPRTQFAGKTSLRATLALPGPGFDWAADADDRQLWISVPSERAVVAADLVTLRSGPTLRLPGAPGRIRVEPVLRRAWVGVARTEAGPGGLAVLEPVSPHQQHWVALTGQGHVEFAFDPAGWVAVTQRESNEVVFIDPTTLRIAHRERLQVPGAMPLNVVFDAAARRFIVAEARGGTLWAFDHRGQPQGRLALSPGIGPMAVTPDGRWLLVANPSAHRVDVVDLPGWQRAHQVPVSGRPFDVAMTATYAYVRALDSEAVSLIALASLATVPRVQAIAMGERPPGRTPQLPLASPLVPMPDGTGSFVASPGDNAIYFYMEGMNAAAGSVSARGHQLRAVRVARRGLREIEPGVHEIEVVLPDAPQLVVALGTESPRTRLCTALALQPAPETAAGWQLAWESFPVDQGRSRLSLQVRGATPAVLPPTLELRLFQPGSSGLVLQATRQAEGRYSAEVPDLAAGLWYVHPQTPSAAHTHWPYVSFLRAPRP